MHSSHLTGMDKSFSNSDPDLVMQVFLIKIKGRKIKEISKQYVAFMQCPKLRFEAVHPPDAKTLKMLHPATSSCVTTHDENLF